MIRADLFMVGQAPNLEPRNPQCYYVFMTGMDYDIARFYGPLAFQLAKAFADQMNAGAAVRNLAEEVR